MNLGAAATWLGLAKQPQRTGGGDYNSLQKIEVDSTNVAKIAYDPETRTAYVEYLNGGLYSYAGVPMSQWLKVERAASVGGAVYDILRGANGRRGLKQVELDKVYKVTKLR